MGTRHGSLFLVLKFACIRMGDLRSFVQ